jgi:tetratricopeptide (TPR) repeat protein
MNRQTLYLASVLILGIGVTVLLSRWMDARRPPPDPSAIDDSLYLNPVTARRMSLGFNGLVADWYWMRSLQYVGKKIISVPEDVPIDDLGQLNLKLLAPLLDTATTLDPEFLDPYEYAAVVLPAVDVQQAIRIARKGIDTNPTAWRLYQHLGYIHWQQKDYQAASDVYRRGAEIPGAPPWMTAMKAKMAAEGGSRATAREIYTRMYEQSTDEKVKDMAQRRLIQLDSLDQRDVLQKVLTGYQARMGQCPATWREVNQLLRAIRAPLDASGAPRDPTGAPYQLRADKCEVDLDAKSEVLTK